jgi:hypothetical protein
MIDFSGINLPFNITELLESAMGLLGIVAPFILLGMVIYFLPTLIQIIRIAAGVFHDNQINADSPRHQQSYGEAIKTYLVEDRFYKSKK